MPLSDLSIQTGSYYESLNYYDTSRKFRRSHVDYSDFYSDFEKNSSSESGYSSSYNPSSSGRSTISTFSRSSDDSVFESMVSKDKRNLKYELDTGEASSSKSRSRPSTVMLDRGLSYGLSKVGFTSDRILWPPVITVLTFNVNDEYLSEEDLLKRFPCAVRVVNADAIYELSTVFFDCSVGGLKDALRLHSKFVTTERGRNHWIHKNPEVGVLHGFMSTLENIDTFNKFSKVKTSGIELRHAEEVLGSQADEEVLRLLRDLGEKKVGKSYVPVNPKCHGLIVYQDNRWDSTGSKVKYFPTICTDVLASIIRGS